MKGRTLTAEEKRLHDRIASLGCIACRYGPKDRIHVHQYLLAHREELVNLLMLELPGEDDGS